jgi:hypothetical protein
MRPRYFLRFPSVRQHLASSANGLTFSQALLRRKRAVPCHFCRDSLLHVTRMYFALVEAHAQHFLTDRKAWQQQWAILRHPSANNLIDT